jgi:hypothetical protein
MVTYLAEVALAVKARFYDFDDNPRVEPAQV